MIPNILSIAGSDPSGGAGIQADIKSISANGGYAMAAITGLTAQNTCGVTRIYPVAPDMVADQIAALRSDIRIDAIKIGMLGTADVIAVVAGELAQIDAPVVLDPVMVAKSGDRLLQANAVSALREQLLPRASIITPNLPEAADLLETAEAQTLDDMAAQAQALLALGPQAVLLKGGHLSSGTSPDLICSGEGINLLDGPRINTKNTHGTGCTLSAALATYLAKGFSAKDAACAAKTYVANAIATSDKLTLGQGHGPTHHFFSKPALKDRITPLAFNKR